jgi:hypothetical protein
MTKTFGLVRITLFSFSHSVTQTYLFPFKEDLCRFDFEVSPEDEYMCDFGKNFALSGIMTPQASS